MKYLKYLFICIFLFTQDAHAEGKLGKIVTFFGDADVTSVATGYRITPEVGMPVYRNYRIRTGKKSFIELLLNDGSKIFIREVSVVNLESLKLKESDPPTKLKMLTGKIRVTVKKTFRDRSFILKTPTAIAGVRGTDFGAITSKNETKLVVFKGKVEVANVKKKLIKSYIVREREEITVLKDEQPKEPRLVPKKILQKWFDYYDVDERNNTIIRSRKKQGFIDRILRKKEY